MTIHSSKDTNLSVETSTGDLVESLLEHCLIVLGTRELEEYSGRSFRQTEATLKVHLFANQRCPLHRELVRRRQQKGT